MQHSTLLRSFQRRLRCQMAGRRLWLRRWLRGLRSGWRHAPCVVAEELLPLVAWARAEPDNLPPAIRNSPRALKTLNLLGPIDWGSFPRRCSSRAWPGTRPHSPLPYILALLMRVDSRQQSMGELVDLLRQQPELAWLAGFAHFATPADYSPSVAAASVPTAAQFSQVLRRLPNGSLQFLLDQTVQLLAEALPPDALIGDVVAVDTKHIIAWVKENNPKAHLGGDRFDKHQQPAGDRDCKLGCKRRSNKGASQEKAQTPPTPAGEGKPAEHLGLGAGEFYWGYASGIAVTKVPLWGEFVLAERTATFDQPDVSYFLPLMQQVERRLGRKPRFGTADAAFDAFYIYDYFHAAGGFAAVPNRMSNSPERNVVRTFAADGTLLCPAGLPMTLKLQFLNRTSRVEHERQRWACPLLYPQPTGAPCPIQHGRWDKGGCCTTVAASDGARIRHQLDREGDAYQAIYNQRTACERIFSQAVALGIEQPKLRNRCSIANLNTLIYVLLNLRTLQRVLDMRSRLAAG